MARRWMNHQFTECKTWGHAWDDVDVNISSKERVAYRMTLRCIRCTTVRIDNLDVEGNVASRSYRYVDGYRDARGTEKPTRPEMRLILIRRR